MPGTTRRPHTSFDISRSYPEHYGKQQASEQGDLNYPYDADELYAEYIQYHNGQESPRPGSPERCPSPRPVSPSPRPGSPTQRPPSRPASRQPSRAQSRLLTARPKTTLGQKHHPEDDGIHRGEKICKETAYTKYDPFTQNYYDRQVANSGPKFLSLPINRQGRAGSSWRHVATTTSMLGGHIAFIEGSVKETDNNYFPLHYREKPREIYTYVSPRLMQNNNTVPTTEIRAQAPPPKLKFNKYNTTYNAHAKQGFKYWYHQPKPLDLASRFRMKAMTMRNGMW